MADGTLAAVDLLTLASAIPLPKSDDQDLVEDTHRQLESNIVEDPSRSSNDKVREDSQLLEDVGTAHLGTRDESIDLRKKKRKKKAKKKSKVDNTDLSASPSTVPLPDGDDADLNPGLEQQSAIDTLRQPSHHSSLDALNGVSSKKEPSPKGIATAVSEDRGFWGTSRRKKRRKKSKGDLPPAITIREEQNIAYFRKIQNIGAYLPHLQNIKHRSRQRNAEVDCYDFSQGLLTSIWHASFHKDTNDFHTDNDIPLTQKLTDDFPKDLDLRLLVVSDLSTDLIGLLGSTLEISPEVFEEHLLHSGWRNGKDAEPGVDTWITRDIDKDYISVKWYRPVKRLLSKPKTNEERLALLDTRQKRTTFTWTEVVIDSFGKPHTVQHSSRPALNVFRDHWELEADVSDTRSVGRAAALLERATIWTRKRRSYRIVVMLLDALPTVSDQVVGAELPLQLLGLYQPTEHITSAPSLPGSPEVSAHDARDRPTPNAFVRKRTRASGPFPRENLIDIPLYVFKSMFNPAKTSGNRTSQQRNERDPEQAQQIHAQEPDSLAPNSPVPEDPLQRSPSRSVDSLSDGTDDIAMIEEEAGIEILTLNPRDRLVFKGLLPRAPPLDYSQLMNLDDTSTLGQYLDTEKSTAEDIAFWIREKDRISTFEKPPSNPLEYLFHIIRNDTLNTLRLMDQSLTQIGTDKLDDSLIQHGLLNWRLLLERFDQELRALEKSLSNFAHFAELLIEPTRGQEENKLSPVSRLSEPLRECLAELKNLRQRTTSSYQSLMANMSIVESKRGIAEAEGVTKLTELAFFFIPLTFSASIFSMQVKELSSADISVSAFIILAVIVTILSYALRLFIRSQSFTQRRRQWVSDIRADSRLAPGSPIPTTTFLFWLWHRLGLLTIVAISTIALIVTPIAFLWTRDFNPTFKAVLTVLLLLLTIATTYVIITAFLYVDSRGLHVRRNIFKFGSRNMTRDIPPRSINSELLSLDKVSWMKSSWFLVILTASAVAVGPLVAIWTQSLATGIKMGATFAIGIMYLALIVWVLARAISRGGFSRQPVEESHSD